MDPTTEAEEQYQHHDFDSDQRWKEFRNNAVTTESEDHLKRVYFRRYFNPKLPLKRSQEVRNDNQDLPSSSAENSRLASSALSLTYTRLVHYAKLLFSRDFIHRLRNVTRSISFPVAVSYVLCLFQLLTIWKTLLFLIDQNPKNFLAAFQCALFASISSLLRSVGVSC